MVIDALEVNERLRPDVVVLDEAQRIKNWNTKTAQAIKRLLSRYAFVLTGTPIENRLLDLWSLMAFATPGILGQRGYFERQFEKRDDPLARQRIAARLRPFLLRRTKREVAPDLPPRVEEDHLCELEGVQADLYRAELKRARGMLLGIENQRQFNEQRFNILQSLLRLRQICCHPGLIDPTMRGESSAKLEALFDLLEPLRDEGHKVLVFSQFVSMLDILRERMIERGWHHFYLTGQTEDRGALVDEFQASPDPAVFLLSLKAAGSGLNLMAASYVVLFDPWWNPAVEAQAIDRTHRIGQANQVMAYRLLVKDSVEEKIRALQERKASLAFDVLGVGEASGALDMKDFDFLFSDEPVVLK
jgi:SNF2 family DNA or RNA helicase